MFRLRCLFLFALLMSVLALFVFWPVLDLHVSGLFVRAEQGFIWRDYELFRFFEKTAFWGARFCALSFLLAMVWTFVRKTSLLYLSSKAWLFLLLALLIGPGLVANVGLKDHWGRARPRDTIVFGGTKTFSPALVPSDQCMRNCSFVSGDASFGFFLCSFAYFVPYRRTQRAFWGLALLGSAFSLSRLFIGAHFLSDIVFAAVLVLGASAGLHALMFGGTETRERWRLWFFS